MTPGLSNEQSFERQMGCMAGFLQLFDRNQILAGKRPYATKRLYPAAGSTSPSERSEASVSSSFMKESQPPPSPEACPSSPESHGIADAPARPSLPFPVFEYKDGMRSSWKLREPPRLSLDSRAIVDGKGKLRPREIRTSGNQSDASDAGDDLDKQRRSPSVVARLMGLEALPEGGGAAVKTAELRRSASESRVSRDMSLFRFVDPNTFMKQPPRDNIMMPGDGFGYKAEIPKPTSSRSSVAASPQRKSFFDAQDFFPEPKRTESLYGEIERRLRMRGIDEPAKDLETLKQILEALQLKGLLHSKLHPQDYKINDPRRSNLVYSDSPIVVMKPAAKSPRRPAGEPSKPPAYRSSPPVRRRAPPEPVPPSRPVRRDRVEMDRNPRGRSPRSPDRPGAAVHKPANVRTPAPQRRSPVHSPGASPKRSGPDPLATRSPRNRREVPPKERICLVDDDSSTISESSISNSSQCDFERSRVDDHRAGRSLLERCDKLLHSIAAITSSPPEQFSATDQQPSPVSVLDAATFLGGDETSPSPAVKRSVDFKDQESEWDGDHWTQDSATVRFDDVEDHDLAYVSEIIHESDRLGDSSDVYALLEKRHHRARPSTAARLHRRLLFDTVAEILDRKRIVPTWNAFTASPLAASGDGGELLIQVWNEMQRIRDGVLPAAGDLNDVTCGAIRKDMVAAGDRGWGGACAAEMSNAVIYIERQIFKDLVAETIRDLAVGKPRLALPRRKLVF